MTARIKKGAITGRPAYSNGGLGLSIGTRVNGVRRAIAHRAPDSIKVAEEVTDTTPIYKLLPISEEFPEVSFDNVSTTTLTYISNINFGYDDVGGGEPSLPLFEYPLANINIRYNTAPVGDGPEDTIVFNFTTGEGGEAIETLFTNPSKNNYTFNIPSINASLSGTDAPFAEQLKLYYDGTNFVTTENNRIVLTIANDTQTLTQFNDNYKTVLSGKTFNLTLTADNVIVIQNVTGINCGTFEVTPPPPL